MTPDDRRYAKSHEWIKVEGDVAFVGISDHAQQALGDITYVELPNVDEAYNRGGEFGVIESVKAASDLYVPVAGAVAETNDALDTTPELVNQDPYGEGWMIKLKDFDADQIEDLMDADAYDDMLEQEE